MREGTDRFELQVPGTELTLNTTTSLYMERKGESFLLSFQTLEPEPEPGYSSGPSCTRKYRYSMFSSATVTVLVKVLAIFRGTPISLIASSGSGVDEVA